MLTRLKTKSPLKLSWKWIALDHNGLITNDKHSPADLNFAIKWCVIILLLSLSMNKMNVDKTQIHKHRNTHTKIRPSERRTNSSSKQSYTIISSFPFYPPNKNSNSVGRWLTSRTKIKSQI